MRPKLQVSILKRFGKKKKIKKETSTLKVLSRVALRLKQVVASKSIHLDLNRGIEISSLSIISNSY